MHNFSTQLKEIKSLKKKRFMRINNEYITYSLLVLRSLFFLFKKNVHARTRFKANGT